jgi:hypothetical protein
VVEESVELIVVFNVESVLASVGSLSQSYISSIFFFQEKIILKFINSINSFTQNRCKDLV